MIKKIHTFNIDHTSESDGQQYRGQFACRRMSMMDRSKINVRKSQLSGGMYCVRDDNGNPTGQGIDQETEWLNYCIAVLEIVLVQKPEWWKLDEISDQEVIFKVFTEVMNFENSFRKRGNGTALTGGDTASGSEANSQAQPAQAVAGSPAPKVVDQKVSAALDA
jgi:hypothetical protein